MDVLGKRTSKMVAKSINCDVCKKNFKSKSHLDIHKKGVCSKKSFKPTHANSH